MYGGSSDVDHDDDDDEKKKRILHPAFAAGLACLPVFFIIPWFCWCMRDRWLLAYFSYIIFFTKGKVEKEEKRAYEM